ncbi:MAG: DUF1501 domain-containing protein [Bacteroidota bacterium]
MITRRKFIQHSALATASIMVPSVLKAFDAPSPRDFQNGKQVIIVQLGGGNDGLNSLVPFRNDIYYKLRPKISIPASKVLKLNDQLGFHPALSGLKALYDSGDLAIVNNVGYPNPVRSHFRSMDIWHTASDADIVWSEGWLGRFLDICPSCQEWEVLNMDETLNLAVRGKKRSGFAVGNIQKVSNSVSPSYVRSMAHHHDHDNEVVSYLYSTLSNTISAADYIYNKSVIYKSKKTYPNTPFGKSCRQVAELVTSGASSSVYYLNLNGFDTHYNQVIAQERLLIQLSGGVSTMVEELKANNKFKDTLIMVFSEFGRRVGENGAEGTDHGTANNVYLISGALKKPGLYNSPPDLSNLKEGDLQFQVDFREVYATILDKWLNVASSQVLKKSFNPLSII